ncbi:MAG: hydrogenase formation protein HypD [candidate division WOR-3 bacterium]
MNYITEFRDKEISKRIIEKIKEDLKDYKEKIYLMEVCGTHTHAFFSSGIMSLLPENIVHLSGPGCPVCVTTNDYIDKAIAYSRLPYVIITTFGDMMRVPGSYSSLEKERAKGNNIKVVYSPIESLNIAKKNPDKKVIFLGVGFETTAPLVAYTILTALNEKIKNFFVLSGHKLIPPAMKALLEKKETKIDGFICPGHVSTIIGEEPYLPIVKKFKIPSVIAGFEPVDILEAIEILTRNIIRKRASLENQYKRVVRKEGNKKALSLMKEVFKTESTSWRGLGVIPNSGLYIKDEYSEIDAEKNLSVEVEKTKENPACRCGEVLRGVRKPNECELFKRVCTPENPIGPCMVSGEGTCAAYYKFKDGK